MSDYERIEKAIRYLDAHYQEQPDLRTLARAAGLSDSHFHRLFSRWAGVTPKDFLQFCTAAHAKNLLSRSRSVLESALDSGLSGPSRLHDLFITMDGVTPGEYKKRGLGIDILYGTHPTPFGECLIGLTERGICYFSFLSGSNHRAEAAAIRDLKRHWLNALFSRETKATGKAAARLFPREPSRSKEKMRLFTLGSPFQVKVWQAIMRIPPGQVRSYQQVAGMAGSPGAARAVGSALAQNPIGYLIPCHRVIRQTGVVGDYRWGRSRKQAMLAWESAKNHLSIDLDSSKACRIPS